MRAGIPYLVNDIFVDFFWFVCLCSLYTGTQDIYMYKKSYSIGSIPLDRMAIVACNNLYLIRKQKKGKYTNSNWAFDFFRFLCFLQCE